MHDLLNQKLSERRKFFSSSFKWRDREAENVRTVSYHPQDIQRRSSVDTVLTVLQADGNSFPLPLWLLCGSSIR